MEITGQNNSENAQERDKAAGEGVDEELARGIAALRAAPNADEKEERDEGQLEEHVKEQDVEGDENADHARFEKEKPGIKLMGPFLNGVPRNQDGGNHQDGSQNDQPDTEAIHADIKTDRLVFVRTEAQHVVNRFQPRLKSLRDTRSVFCLELRKMDSN